MKKKLCLVLVLVLVFSFNLQAFASTQIGSLTEAENKIMSAIDNKKAETTNIANKIWEFKEGGWEEFKSSALLMDEFEKQGFTVQRGLLGKHPKYYEDMDMPTAFKAVFKGKEGGPTIGVMLEYDAMPNGHSCGHNLISSSGFSTAMGLKEAFTNEPGTVIVYGCPAEEKDGAKPNILAGGFMDEVDLMVISHYGSEWNSEVKGKAIVWPTHDNWITFKGKAAHASSSPHEGKDALDAVMLTAMGLEFLREHVIETNRIHYIIGQGGQQANSVPNSARLDLELRANDSGELNSLMKRADDIIKGAELMTGTTAEYRWDAPWYTATPVPSLYRAAAKFAPLLGIPENKFSFGALPKASSDVGSVAYKIPTFQIAFPIVKEGEATPTGHSDELAAITNTEFAINQSILASKLMALTAYRIGTNPEELKALKDEFENNYSE